MLTLKKGSLRIPSGTRRDAAKRLAGEKLLECAQNLTPELAALNRAARRYYKLLSRDVSAAEIAVLAIPATALLESLGVLFNCEDKPVKNLNEVKAFLTMPVPLSAPPVKRTRKQKARPVRRVGTRR